MQSISANSSNDNIDPSKFTHFVKPREYFKYIGLDKIVSMFDFYELQMDFDEADNFEQLSRLGSRYDRKFATLEAKVVAAVLPLLNAISEEKSSLLANSTKI